MILRQTIQFGVITNNFNVFENIKRLFKALKNIRAIKCLTF